MSLARPVPSSSTPASSASPGAPATPATLVDLGPVAQLRAGRLGRRLAQLLVGLVLYGVSLAMMVRGDLGLAPWDVLHSGIAEHLGVGLGVVVEVVSFVLLLAWIPLREVPGVGTLLNALVVGAAVEVSLALLPAPSEDALAVRVALMLGGIALCGLATACYIGPQLGRGPRDGLMTGLHRRTGLSLRAVRTGLELGVVGLGLLLGGHLGLGTVLYAISIGPIAQALLPAFTVRLDAPAPR